MNRSKDQLWGNKLNALQKILQLFTPKKETKPRNEKHTTSEKYRSFFYIMKLFFQSTQNSPFLLMILNEAFKLK